MLARRILGLDMGSHAAKAVELRQTLRGLEVVQLRHLPFDDPTPGVAVELRDVLSAYDLPRDFVVVSLAGDRISTRRLAFPFRDRRKIGPAVPFEVEGQVPFALDDYFVDWEIVGERKNETEVVATLAPRTEVALLLESLERGRPLAAHRRGRGARALEPLLRLRPARPAPPRRRRAPEDHALPVRRRARGGLPHGAGRRPRAHAGARARSRASSEVEAERSKIEEGVLGGRSTAALEVLDRLAREILRTIGSLESLLPGGIAGLQAVHLLGGSARLHRLDEYLSERTGLPAQRLPLPAGELGSAFLAGGDPLLFGPALALALRGSSRAATRMNLRQDELAQRIDFARSFASCARRSPSRVRRSCWVACRWARSMALDERRTDAVERQARALYAGAARTE